MSFPLWEKAKQITSAAIDAVRPDRLINDNLKRDGDQLEIQGRTFDLAEFEAVDIIAFGKAAPGMAAAVTDILGNRLRRGIIAGLPGFAFEHPRFERFEASHPLPDERSEAAARAALELARRSGPSDLLVLLVSGGGSSLLCAPLPGISLADKMCVTRELLVRGADIRELNIVRKHLSAVKGGRLALAAKAGVVNLIISDVVGDDPEVIASGPGYWDSSTFAEAVRILSKFDYYEAGPAGVKAAFESGLAGGLEETLKKNDAAFDRVSAFLVGCNAVALAAAKREAEAAGFQAMVLAGADSGEARDAAARYIPSLLASVRSRGRSDRPLALIAGGEHTVTVRGKGLGGRNQEFVLAVLVELERRARAGARSDRETFGEFLKNGRLNGRDWLVLSLGTDGVDGPTEAAGAWAGPATLVKLQPSGLNLAVRLDDNDSYNVFKKIGGLIVTGPTGTNVMDLRLILVD